MRITAFAWLFTLSLNLTPAAFAAETDLKVGDKAPLFTAKNQANTEFSLASRQGHWTVLYFYPKAGTPGCTKQACAFRDAIKKIRDEGAEVYGISTDTVEKQAEFHKEHKLSFDILADPEGKVTEQYGNKMPVVTVAKRWTFIIDPDLKIAQIDKDVDPLLDAKKVAESLVKLKAAAPKSKS